jgi:quercetin dioxygenase-like cupin family protein
MTASHVIIVQGFVVQSLLSELAVASAKSSGRETNREMTMIRCVRIWTGDNNNSLFEEGVIDLDRGPHGDILTGKLPVTTVSFQETGSGGKLDWHTAPVRQLVVTLSGTLDFETRSGQHFTLRPGDILLAEDTVGGGHSWKLIDDQPWRRAYVVLAPGAAVPFRPHK